MPLDLLGIKTGCGSSTTKHSAEGMNIIGPSDESMKTWVTCHMCMLKNPHCLMDIRAK